MKIPQSEYYAIDYNDYRTHPKYYFITMLLKKHFNGRMTINYFGDKIDVVILTVKDEIDTTYIQLICAEYNIKLYQGNFTFKRIG